jgi:hypothetical protein
MNSGFEQRPLEERIREARAERSVALGYAIGDALAAFWRVLSALPFSPSSPPARKPGRPASLLARFASHR